MILRALMLPLFCGILFVVTCRQVDEKTPAQAPPVAAEDSQNDDDSEPPLLLPEGDEEDDLPEYDGPVADNSRCFACHINFKKDELAVLHARAEIGCEKCHGPCYAHCEDEDNITPPDIMFPKEKINPSCLKCHENPEGDQHKPIMTGTAVKKKYCTDCHGKTHHPPTRTRRWDKTTGELIEDDKVRMMTDEMLKKS